MDPTVVYIEDANVFYCVGISCLTVRAIGLKSCQLGCRGTESRSLSQIESMVREQGCCEGALNTKRPVSKFSLLVY